MSASNPLLQATGLPLYSRVEVKHWLPALQQVIAEHRQAVVALGQDPLLVPNWDDVAGVMDQLDGRLHEVWSHIRTLALRAGDSGQEQALQACGQAWEDYQHEVATDQRLFQCYQALRDSPAAALYEPSRKALLDRVLRNFILNGVDLNPLQQQRLAQIDRQLGQLEGRFLDNLRGANQAFVWFSSDERGLAGLSAGIKAQMAAKARALGKTGWALTLDDEPLYLSVLAHSEQRQLREDIYLAYHTRASELGPGAGQYDNGPVLKALLGLRREKALLLGFTDYPALSQQAKADGSNTEVMAVLKAQLASHGPAFGELSRALKGLAAEHGIGQIRAWDWTFLLRQRHLRRGGVSEQQLREYFPLDAVLAGLGLLAQRLFGIEVLEQHPFERWHGDVRLFEFREFGLAIGHLYVDPFARAGKPGWVSTQSPRNRRVTLEGQRVTPIAIIFADFPSPPSAQEPALLTYLQVRQLFHEFGHALQQILSRADYGQLSGIQHLGREAEEFVGKLFEQFCASREVLAWLARHYQTGARLSSAMVTQLLALGSDEATLGEARDLMRALFDFELHLTHGDGREPHEVLSSVQAGFAMGWPEQERFACSFDYLVTGYDAAYYAYPLGEALAKKAFARFEREGLFNPKVGKSLRDRVLAPGAGGDFRAAVEAFVMVPSRSEPAESVDTDRD